jgi:chaperone modulatory protein CbpM
MTMRDEADILQTFAGLGRETLHVWIERGWLAPQRSGDVYRFREIDVARIRLIQEFHFDLAIDEDAMDVILRLLDQVHGLRRQLRRFADAINAQPESVREQIIAKLEDSD